jgi:2-methylcitrate dehydratase PrpD
VPGRPEGVSGHAAALLAGASAHAFDFDDTHAQAQIHPGAPIVAAALAAAQTSGADARALITGIIAGYEVMARVSYGLNPDAHSRKGFHLTATTGVFGAAAAAAVVQGHGPEVLEHAWGTCLSMSAGSGQFLANGAWTKRLHVGLAAANGYGAVQHAAAGVTGASDALSGRDGFFNLYSPDPQPQEALRGLGTVWEIMGSAVKPYPCCRAIHAPLDALLGLRRDHEFGPEDIESIRVGVPERCHAITCAPATAKRNPQNMVDCQFSMHLCLALAVVRGRVSFADYDDALHDPAIDKLMQRIEAVVDDEAEAVYPRTFPGRISIRLRSGTLLERYIEVPFGEPERMLSREQLTEKFVALAGPGLPSGAAEHLFEAGISLADTGADLGSVLGWPKNDPLEGLPTTSEAAAHRQDQGVTDAGRERKTE